MRQKFGETIRGLESGRPNKDKEITKIVMGETMSVLKCSLVLLMVLVFASQTFVFLTFAEASEDEAISALASAEESVILAYQAVLKAEEAGADVSGLLVRLNEAGGFLARARMAYRLGDFDEATRVAGLSKNVGVEVQNDAVVLNDSAISDGLQRIMFTTIASVIGVAFIALGSIWVWYFMKKRYGSAESLKAS